MLGQKKVKLTMRAICAGFLCAVCAMSGAQALASGTGVSELPAKTGKNRAGSKTFAAKASKTNREPKTARTLKVKKSAKSLSDGKKNTVAPGLSAIHDAELIAIYQHLLNGQINPALKQTEAMLAKAPNFRLGHLLHGDLLAIKALRPIAPITANAQFGLLGENEVARRMTELRAEAQLRLFALQHPPKAGEIPNQLIGVDASVPRVVFVDALRSRLYVYENSPKGLYLLRSFYITQGRLGMNKAKEGDQKTPVGVYFNERPLDQRLPDLYGYGALNTDYPNAWDKRKNRTGHGIWLHGTPKETYARAPYASDGCVVLSNPDIASIFELVQSNVPLVFADNLKFVPAQSLKSLNDEVTAQLMQWVNALTHEPSALQAKMAPFYANDFAPDVGLAEEMKEGQSLLVAWLNRKSSYAQNRPGVKPTVSHLSVLAYPGEEGMVMTRFQLQFGSQAKQAKATGKKRVLDESTLQKTLYWRKNKGQWQIVLETAGQT